MRREEENWEKIWRENNVLQKSIPPLSKHGEKNRMFFFIHPNNMRKYLKFSHSFLSNKALKTKKIIKKQGAVHCWCGAPGPSITPTKKIHLWTFYCPYSAQAVIKLIPILETEKSQCTVVHPNSTNNTSH